MAPSYLNGRLQKPDGSDLLIELLRPMEWLDWHQARLGGEIELDLEELGAAGPALVLAIEPCPPIRPQPAAGYRLVAGRFAHASADVLDLVLAGADGTSTTLGVTSNHPFWSEDAQAFVPAGKLTPGTRLLTATGHSIHVFSLTPRPGREGVYNIEVDVEHVYHVADAGVLVHNACHWHHTIPREIRRKLPAPLRRDKDIIGRRGLPNRRSVSDVTHKNIHDRTGISINDTGIRGGKYNLRFDEEIMARGGYRRVTKQQILDIRDLLVREFGM